MTLVPPLPSPTTSLTNFLLPSLNFFFMTIQAFYGLLTDSLGLLSDSIHMFFDCLALALGLFAAVASKWPPSTQFPYGFGKIESLSGFGNGVFLMLISVEILVEAGERLVEGREAKRLNELLVVSTLGLVVNLVGMAAFGHHHHGHDHSHGGGGGGCAHGHSHGHEHSQSPSHSHENEKSHESSNDLAAHHHPGSGSGLAAHTHGNENLHGIFLHILADTLGSAAVILSTLLTQWLHWPGFDPLASSLIAILIFLSSIPLVKSSARKLLLSVDDGTEYLLRNALSGVSDLRGVGAWHVGRFWVVEGGVAQVGQLGDRHDGGEEQKGGDEVVGVMHLTVTRGSDVEDVRERVRLYLAERGVDVCVQVEREGDGRCWCGGGDTVKNGSGGSGGAKRRLSRFN